jgi:serine/threonine protein kinase
MPLSAGTRLGPYEILASIGAGGMGEVYKARDTRLDRIVAIKISKTEFSERFEREALLAAVALAGALPATRALSKNTVTIMWRLQPAEGPSQLPQPRRIKSSFFRAR